jgi:hypothetical protein
MIQGEQRPNKAKSFALLAVNGTSLASDWVLFSHIVKANLMKYFNP